MSEYPEFVFISYDQDISTQTYDIAVSCEAGSLVGKPVKYVRHDLNTRAVPDVPELVTVSYERKIYENTKDWFAVNFDDVEYYRSKGQIIRELVTRSQAAAIIAAKDSDIALKDAGLKIAMTQIAALKAKLAQYEAQEPVGYFDGKVDYGVGGSAIIGIDTSTKDGRTKPLYASPAPSADLKAENERLREALQDIANLYQPRTPIQRAINIARAALNVEASHDPH